MALPGDQHERAPGGGKRIRVGFPRCRPAAFCLHRQRSKHLGFLLPKRRRQMAFSADRNARDTPAGAIFVSDFHDQQHFVWNDGSGRLWDSFYAQADDNWHFQEINTEGHPAAGNLFVSVFGAADQQHFVYTDSAGDVWDSFYIRGDDLWSYAQVNTNGHRPVGGIFVSDFFDQQHFVFPDGGGIVWDSFYAQQGNSWHFNKIQNTFDCSMGASMNELDLTRNEAPCNAINKIVSD